MNDCVVSTCLSGALTACFYHDSLIRFYSQLDSLYTQMDMKKRTVNAPYR